MACFPIQAHSTICLGPPFQIPSPDGHVLRGDLQALESHYSHFLRGDLQPLEGCPNLAGA